MRVGGTYLGNHRCAFSVWSPFSKSLSVKITSPLQRSIPLDKDTRGYWRASGNDLPPGTRYLYSINEVLDRPDPASHSQPEGVHASSQIIDHDSFSWHDTCWKGLDLPAAVIYEIHVGTFTPEGTFDAVVPRIAELRDLGVSALELMPVAQFPGERNWGYDGVYPFAPQNSYGGPDGLKRLVDGCHRAGISVILDVVYNHFGPEGAYFLDFGPYYTPKYKTPWGDAINFDSSHSDEVRNYFIQNALHWFTHYHVDALRLDAIHSILDASACPFLRELSDAVELLSRSDGNRRYLIAESDLNDAKVVRSRDLNGYGLNAQWSDDFHHSLHALLTGEKAGYYQDFGTASQMAKAFRDGFVFTGQYSRYRKRSHGNSTHGIPSGRFVVFTQNHDQTGNRMLGERLSSLVSFESLKLAAMTLFSSPFIPLLFMGEEYGEKSPFLYFVSHGDRALIEAVRNGRKEEFKEFAWAGTVPDPESAQTFLASKIRWEDRTGGEHAAILRFYRELIRLRGAVPALAVLSRGDLSAVASDRGNLLQVERRHDASRMLALFNFDASERQHSVIVPEGAWRRILDSSDTAWNGPGSLLPSVLDRDATLRFRPRSAAFYEYPGEKDHE